MCPLYVTVHKSTLLVGFYRTLLGSFPGYKKALSLEDTFLFPRKPPLESALERRFFRGVASTLPPKFTQNTKGLALKLTIRHLPEAHIWRPSWRAGPISHLPTYNVPTYITIKPPKTQEENTRWRIYTSNSSYGGNSDGWKIL